MKTETGRNLPRALVFAVASLALCVLLGAILYDPVALFSDAASVARVRWELPRARDRWQTSVPATYQIHVKGAVPLACIVDAELTVRDGKLVGVRARENPLVPSSPLRPVPQGQWGSSGCPFEDLTPEAMFVRADAAIAGTGILGAPLTIKFDDQRGFIREYRSGRASQGGVFGYVLSECCTWFEFDDFRESPP